MKNSICIIIILALISVTSLGQTTYYISNTGSNSANGTTTLTPWQTISKVNSTTLVAGDKVLFQAGGVWREELDVKQGASGTGKRITYGRYGDGDNPKILGSNKAENWTATSVTNIWQSATVLDNPQDGDWGYPGNIFFESGTTVTWGIYRTYNATFSNLTKEFDWTWYNNRIYCYASSDPDTRYTAVEASQRDLCMGMNNAASSYITVDGIDLHYARRAGYGYTSYPEAPGQTDVTFANCNIGYIGVKGGACAYGIEAFHSNFLVENCTITDCGRRGISFNLYEDPSERGVISIDNVVVRNNVFKRGQHTTSLDFATADNETGDVLQNIFYYNNIVDDSEITWGEEDNTSNQVYFQPYAATFRNIYVYNNVFVHATARNILVTGGNGVYIWYNTIVGHNPNIDVSPYGNVSLHNEDVNGLINVEFKNNILYSDLPSNSLYNYGLLIDHSQTVLSSRDYNLYYQTVLSSRRGFTGGYFGYYGTDSWSSFKSSNPTWETHSPVPGDPLFAGMASGVFTVTAGSPAINAGTPIAMVTTDRLGNARSNTTPTLGAFEYNPGTNVYPSISISSPSNGSTYTAPATITITANATDPDGTISNVEFYNGTTKLGEKATSPYTYTWSSVAAGTYSITAVATDNLGAKTTSSAVSVTVNSGVNTPPTVSIISPINGSTYTAPANITITATAADANGSVTKVMFYNGTTKLGEKASVPYTLTWSSVPTGVYSLTAVAVDNQSATTTSTAVQVTVTSGSTNTPPTVAITSPSNGSAFTAPADILVTANATDADGTISSVVFYSGATQIGQATAGPYSFLWNDVAAGTYILTAFATDNKSASTTSTPVTITVNPTEITAEGELILYPNPNDGTFRISMNVPLPADENIIWVCSKDGTIVYEDVILKEETDKDFQIPNLKTGAYVVIIIGNNRIIATKKFIRD